MGSQEYVIKGTVSGMVEILKKDFDVPYEEAKFFVYMMINRHNRETVNTVSKDDLDIWYLEAENQYEGQILNTHLVINFTTIKMELYRQAYRFLVKYFFGRGIDLLLIGTDLVYVIVKAIRKIQDTDYCVYARIIELCLDNHDKFFDINDIITANKDGKCDYQEKDWICTHLGRDENCTCNNEKIALAFFDLEKQNIIKKAGEHWILVH